jgi:hypothetical protein
VPSEATHSSSAVVSADRHAEASPLVANVGSLSASAAARRSRVANAVAVTN